MSVFCFEDEVVDCDKELVEEKVNYVVSIVCFEVEVVECDNELVEEKVRYE